MSGQWLRVVRGDPTPQELAALVAVLAARSRAAAAQRRQSRPPSPWSAPAAAHRAELPVPGPGAWAAAIGPGTAPAGPHGRGGSRSGRPPHGPRAARGQHA